MNEWVVMGDGLMSKGRGSMGYRNCANNLTKISYWVQLLFFISLLITHDSLLSYAGELDTSVGPTAANEIPSAPMPTVTPQLLEAGKKIFDLRCAPCHGFEGAGEGPAAISLDPRPRDFTRGLFKFKTTEMGQVVADNDLFRTISRGIPGTAMPSWKRVLSEEERWQVIAYVKTFSDRFKDAPSPKSFSVGEEPPMTPESIAKGNEIFHKKAQPPCALCHGENGKGNGPLAPFAVNAWAEPLFPRNLTQSWTYKSGNTPPGYLQSDLSGDRGDPDAQLLQHIERGGALARGPLCEVASEGALAGRQCQHPIQENPRRDPDGPQ